MDPQSKNPNPGDHRYESFACPHCRRTWQLIDWRCAHHRLVCGEMVDDANAVAAITESLKGMGYQVRAA